MTTARDVAERLGVSVSTVGRALSDDPRISSTTKARVNSMAREMGYVASNAARMMRGRPSRVVGVLVPDISNAFYAGIAHTLAHVVSRQGLLLMIGQTGDDPVAELQQVEGFVATQVSGAVLVRTGNPHPELARALAGLPHAHLLRDVDGPATPWFGIDDESALRTATEHLVALGHRSIGFVGGTPDLPTGAARQRGYRLALAGAGIAVDDALVRTGPPSSEEAASSAVDDLLDLPHPPSAVVVASVRATGGVLLALDRRGIDVPGQMSVVGFGDEPGYAWWGPGLTTVSLPVPALATACADWVVCRLPAGPSRRSAPSSPGSPVQAPPPRLALPASLTRRGSAAASSTALVH